ncbi:MULTISPECIES: multicopper oxidase family protein [unclassified Rhizobium]|uniref:multicopper oxidase family protein n=1 Tax=unclassified Rhizobium TaxID=2613769 RepID=UPI000BA84484|nr:MULTISPECIES: multicopper oxidase family protein [unclassified Rhizobium]ASW10484.1 copper oxidase [Rhizobium sp. 11515TR]MDK4716271.1 multicopper oxidase family protein [Rhizobium sp. CNPSo 4039]
MYRRNFLAGLAGLAISGRASAQMMHDMGSMNGTHNMTPAAGNTPVLPEGQPLRELPRLRNEAGEAGLFKARLTAERGLARFAEGLDTPVLLYNGGNPVVEAYEGDRIEISFRNGIPDEPTTVHWHGVPVPADQDGSPMEPVASGSERIYAFDLPLGSAASYWFHPHPHGLTAAQVYRGLAGIFLVKPKDDPIPAEYGDTMLMFTDLRIAEDGSMPASNMIDLMNGRVGDHVLVNGQKNPVLAVAKGEKRRLRLLNATNARFLRLRFENATMVLVGTDGGLIEAPISIDDLLLAPAERVELIISFDRPGAAKLVTLDYERGWMGPGKPDEAGMTLLTASVSEEAAPVAPPLPAKLRTIDGLAEPSATRRFVLTESMEGMEMKFLINGASFDMTRVDEVSKVGQVELWEIVNQADMDHPFHVHGTQFQLIEREKDGAVTKSSYRAWKDTVNVAAGETVRILLRQELPGPRMYHCHILEHEDLGMMGMIDVRA